MKVALQSDIGKKRMKNEDAIFVSVGNVPMENLYIVADGMGGCDAGDIASQTAISSFIEELKKPENTGQTDVLDRLMDGIVAANKRVFEVAQEGEVYHEIGTTFLVAQITGERLFLVNVGDSRAYLFREGELRQLTVDHSYVMELVRTGNITQEEAEHHPKKNLITRAVGAKETVEADTVLTKLQLGDKILLCTDGLTNMVSKEDICTILQLSIDPEEKVQQLVEQANQNGGLDNISVILIEIEELGSYVG